MLADDGGRAPGWRIGALGVVVIGAVCVLLSRLWTVQIVNSDAAVQRSQEQTTVKVRLAPARGAIVDRNGLPLAENRPSFDIDFDLSTLKRSYAESHHGRWPQFRLKDDKEGRPRYEPDIVQIVKESIQPISQTLGLTAPLNEKEIREHFRTDPDLPYHYMTDLDFATVAQFEERNSGVPGIKIAQNPARIYNYGAFASHILGYVGRPENQKEHTAADGTPYEMVGRHGIEAVMDAHLQGQPGNQLWRVSSQGYYKGDAPIEETDPTMGNTVYLTIDARIQYIIETSVRASPWTRVAVVVMDPHDGDVLGLASFPDYDPNIFIPHISAKDWNTLNTDPTTPLYDRALHSYPPGSTYKIMVALAGLQSGNVTADTDFDCPAAIQIDDHLFHNSDRSPAGTMSLVDAIRVSSDVFFYQYGIRAGIEAIDAMGLRAGFGHAWGLVGDGDEDAGILPGPEWMKQNKEWLDATHNVDRWSHAQTANTSIGQGFVEVTPLQMATFLCAVANGGTVYQPRLYSKVVDYEGEIQAEPLAGQVFSTLNVTPRQLQSVRQGMYGVVEEDGGTANLTAKIPGYHLAGKTGTAQAYRKVDGVTKQDLKTWFYCYGPFENPRYVTCVMVEGGTWGGTAAAPIAADIMKRLFAMDAGEPVNVAPLTPLQGNFNGVTDIDTHAPDNPVDANGNPVVPDGPVVPSPPPPPSARTSGSGPSHGH